MIILQLSLFYIIFTINTATGFTFSYTRQFFLSSSHRLSQQRPKKRQQVLLLHAASSSSSSSASAPIPINGQDWPHKFPAKSHCSKCGLCETSFVSRVSDACAFLNDGMSRIDDMEVKVHGRARDLNDMSWSGDSDRKEEDVADEGRFGVLHSPMKLAKGVGVPNAQWTGVVTGIALSMLESGLVDAVVCIASKQDDSEGEGSGEAGWSEPMPIIARTVEEVLRGRGVKPALAPSLKVLDEIQSDSSIQRLLFCGVGCAVQAFRQVQDELDLEKVYVLGTNCVDNSPTPEAAREFLNRGVSIPNINQVKGYEFMQDFRVHVKMENGKYIKKPYFSLTGTIADAAIADSCLACFDYTNALADVVVGYMGAPLDPANGDEMDQSYQTLTVRNERGQEMVQTALEANKLHIGKTAVGQGLHETITMATVNADSIVLKMIGGDVKEQGMPRLIGEVMASIFRFIGPKGVNFARYSIDYHLLRNYLHSLDEWGEERVNSEKAFLPQYAKDIVEKYLEEDESFRKLRDQILSSSSSSKDGSDS